MSQPLPKLTPLQGCLVLLVLFASGTIALAMSVIVLGLLINLFRAVVGL